MNGLDGQEESIEKFTGMSETRAGEEITAAKKKRIKLKELLSDKPTQLDIYTFKRGGVSITQQSFPLSNHPSTIKDLSLFQARMAQHEGKFDSFPSQFRGLIACLVQESELECGALTRSILNTLCPKEFFDSGGSVINLDILGDVVNRIALRCNYGLLCETNPRLQCWVWEVQDLSLFPESLAEMILSRRRKREQASTFLQEYFNNLPYEHKCIIYGKEAPTPLEAQPTEDISMDVDIPATQSQDQDVLVITTVEDPHDSHTGVSRQIVKRKCSNASIQRLKGPKKAKLAESQKFLVGFFRKVDKSQAPAESREKAHTSPKVAQSSLPITALIDTSRIHALVKYLIVALKERARRSRMLPAPVSQTAGSNFGLILDYSNSLAVPQVPAKNSTVDYELPKWKLFQYHGSVRPGYWGTWSKTSTIITGRRPLAMDKNFIDYDHDSEEEWDAQDEIGEELKSEEDLESEECESSRDINDEDACSNCSSWLVPNGYLSDGEGMDSDVSEDFCRAKVKQHKFDINPSKEVIRWCFTKPLVPIAVGPFYTGTSEPPNVAGPIDHSLCSPDDSSPSIATLVKFSAVRITRDINLDSIIPIQKRNPEQYVDPPPTGPPTSENHMPKSRIADEGALLRWFKQSNAANIPGRSPS